ncbi:hypothetical protein KL86DYS2_12811 [uncultured Dysgonomonas sp.]|uniref:Uncharacterized protein n=1 Tax=uncultured Dysgonomonas sp. TaxID=206096 RepID=A0A212K1H4_9BACT|nr:hypothetical protein KL86DYS2_12811 [uncultured Dysgonomonas sp.]
MKDCYKSFIFSISHPYFLDKQEEKSIEKVGEKGNINQNTRF